MSQTGARLLRSAGQFGPRPFRRSQKSAICLSGTVGSLQERFTSPLFNRRKEAVGFSLETVLTVTDGLEGAASMSFGLASSSTLPALPRSDRRSRPFLQRRPKPFHKEYDRRA